MLHDMEGDGAAGAGRGRASTVQPRLGTGDGRRRGIADSEAAALQIAGHAVTDDLPDSELKGGGVGDAGKAGGRGGAITPPELLDEVRIGQAAGGEGRDRGKRVQPGGDRLLALDAERLEPRPVPEELAHETTDWIRGL